MTNVPQTSPGTETSVPGALSLPPGSDAQTVAALQSMLAVMAASLNSPSPTAADPAPDPAPAPTVPSAPAASSAASTTLAIYPSTAPVPVGFLTSAPWVAGALYRVVPVAPLMLSAPVDDGNVWYCITRGKYVGVTTNNSLAVAGVSGVSRSAMNSYKTQALAVTAFNELLAWNMVTVIAP